MRLLLTRPENEALKSKQKLEEMGHEVLLSPVLEIDYSFDPLPRECEALAITSKNALIALQGFSNFEELSHLPVYCVGDATADLAKEIGFHTVFSASGTVDNLVMLIGSQKINFITYVCGRERKGNLEGKLSTKGLTVFLAERYQAKFSDSFSVEVQNAFRQGAIDGVLFYSARSAEAYLSLVEYHNISYLTNNLTYFCLAKSIVNVFDSHNKEQIVVAENPDEKSLFQLLV